MQTYFRVLLLYLGVRAAVSACHNFTLETDFMFFLFLGYFRPLLLPKPGKVSKINPSCFFMKYEDSTCPKMTKNDQKWSKTPKVVSTIIFGPFWLVFHFLWVIPQVGKSLLAFRGIICTDFGPQNRPKILPFFDLFSDFFILPYVLMGFFSGPKNDLPKQAKNQPKTSFLDHFSGLQPKSSQIQPKITFWTVFRYFDLFSVFFTNCKIHKTRKRENGFSTP